MRLNDPIRASSVDGRLRFTAADGQSVDIITTPDAAEAVVAAFQGSLKYYDPAIAEEREGTA